MRFLIDAQLPPALAAWFITRGHAAEHVADVGLLDADDDPIWQYAVAHDAVIVTKDEDFANRKAAVSGGPSIVWLRVGNCSNRALLQWFTPLLPAIVGRLQQGEEVLEVV